MLRNRERAYPGQSNVLLNMLVFTQRLPEGGEAINIEGRIAIAKRKSIVRLAQEALTAQAAYGHSKKDERNLNGGEIPAGRIYSYSTMSNYIQASTHFVNWAKTKYGCRTLDDARYHVSEYLRMRINDGKSAWTVAKDACALGKMYGCRSTDFGVDLPTRHRNDISQHRDPTTYDGHFSESRNADLVDLARACGLRRHEIAALRPEDVWEEDGKILVHVAKGKGGKERTVEALNDAPLRLAEHALAVGRDKVIEHIPKYAPIHAYRREYAHNIYERYMRPIEQLPKAEQYRCRGDLAGYVFDKVAMKIVTGNLGHNRLDVVTHYIA